MRLADKILSLKNGESITVFNKHDGRAIQIDVKRDPLFPFVRGYRLTGDFKFRMLEPDVIRDAARFWTKCKD